MIERLLEGNRTWATSRVEADPGFFERLASQQSPRYLWIGCSDSRVPANEIVGMDPGEVFVHRNVANIVPPRDMNALSVLQYSIEVLKVRHVIVCGHYGCGGIRAALEPERHGLIDHWLQPVADMARTYKAELDALPDFDARVDAICERNVRMQFETLIRNPFVSDAWARGQKLDVHGWIYSIRDGLLRNLGLRVGSAEEAVAFSR